MQCFVLGTGGMMPLPQRRLSSVVLRPSSVMYQVDCGEGVQVGFKELRLGIKALSLIAITHLHADHCLGLPGVLMFRAQCEDPGPLVILGPIGIERFVRNVIADLSCHINFPIEFLEWQPGADPLAYRDDTLALTWAPLVHGVTCLGYRFEEHARPGRFDPDRARALGVPQGPLWGALQGGEVVVSERGAEVHPEEVLGPPRRGRVVSYCTDTAPCDNVEALCRGADLAFVESMFLPEHEEEGRRKQHMTGLQAARITATAGAKRTALIHISPRYGPADLRRLQLLVSEVNPTATIARELETYDVALPD
jgi:ribonuclease Z